MDSNNVIYLAGGLILGLIIGKNYGKRRTTKRRRRKSSRGRRK
jgi:hypothetical protein